MVEEQNVCYAVTHGPIIPSSAPLVSTYWKATQEKPEQTTYDHPIILTESVLRELLKVSQDGRSNTSEHTRAHVGIHENKHNIRHRKKM